MLCKKDIDTLSPIYPDVDWSKTIWSFIHYSKTDPDSDLPDDVDDLIMISLEHSDGGCLFELSFEWVWMSGADVPRLTCFNDALPALLTPTLMESSKTMYLEGHRIHPGNGCPSSDRSRLP